MTKFKRVSDKNYEVVAQKIVDIVRDIQDDADARQYTRYLSLH